MIIFIYGKDEFRSRQKIEKIKEKFSIKSDTTGSNIEIINGDDFDINKFREKIYSPALFSKGRMIIIKNLLKYLSKKEQEEVLQVLQKIDDNVVVFWEINVDKNFWKKIIKTDLYKFLKQTKYAQGFDKLTGMELQKWAEYRYESLGGKADSETIKNLVAMVGENLFLLDNELQKLATYKQKEKLTDADIDILVEMDVDSDIFVFTDALARNDKFVSLKILNEKLQSGISPLELLSKIIWQFRILLLIKEITVENNINSTEIASRLKIHPFVVKKSLPLVKNFSLQKLYFIFEKLLNLDMAIKSGTIEEKLSLNLFIADI